MKSVLSGAAVLSAALMMSASAFGASVSTLAALGANDGVIWTGAEPNGTNAFSVFTNMGYGVIVSEPSSNFVATQQNPPGGWFGNFPAGTKLVYDQGPSGVVTFSFSQPIRGFGLTIDDAYGGGYTGLIQGYNGDESVGAFSSSLASPGLMFLGILDGKADITSVTIGTTAVGNNSFAFGNLSLVDGTTSSAPEPASIGLVLIGLSAVAVVNVRKSHDGR